MPWQRQGEILTLIYSVVKTLGFNTTITLVMTCPPFIFAGAAGIFFGWNSGRMHERTWHITAGLSVAIVGFALAAATLNTAARYVACFIFPMGAYAVNSVIIGWASSTLSQTKEKKAVVLAMTNVGGQVSPLIFVLRRSCTNHGVDWLYLRCLPLAQE
jgi:multisubunit Na+/H+ antiporter MnhG subunit